MTATERLVITEAKEALEADRQRRIAECRCRIDQVLAEYGCRLDVEVVLRAGQVVPRVLIVAG